MKSQDKAILRLAVPSVVSNITVPLIGLVDIAITGHLGGAVLISAIAVGAMTFNVIYWLFGFLRMGTSGLVAQAYGRGSRTEPSLTAWRVLSLGAVIGLLFICFRHQLFILSSWAFSTPSNVLPAVRSYFGICIYGAPAMLCLYGLNGWFIGMQDTRLPMVVAIAQNIINMAVGITLAVGFGMGIRGIATGTLVAQWSGCLFLLAALVHRIKTSGLLFVLRPKLIFRLSEIVKFFRLNAVIFVRTVCIVAVNLYFTAAGSRQGALTLATNTVLLTFFTIFSYFMDGFAYAGEALCGQLYGRGDTGGLRSMVARLFGWGGVMVVVFTIAYLAGGDWFVGLLTDDAAVAACAQQYELWTVLIPVSGMAAFVLDGVFVGVTASTGMLSAAALSAGLFFGLYHWLFPLMGNHGLWLAFIVYLAARGIVELAWMKGRKILSGRPK